MSDTIYSTLKDDILPALRYKIIQEKNDFEKIEFVITLDVHGILIRLKKFKNEDFLYIDGFIHIEKPIPKPAMLALHSIVDNDIMVGVNVDTTDEEDEFDDSVHNILLNSRIYKDSLTISKLDRDISVVYNCMNKMSGIIIGLNSAFAHKKEFDKSGRSIAPPPSGDELKSYG